MFVSQAIKSPQGVSAFGSSLIRVPPDYASLDFAVTRMHKTPEDAFTDTRNSVQAVREHLANVDVNDVQTSRITLTQQYRYNSGNVRVVEGYIARSSFNLLFDDLNLLEPLMCGIIQAGVNEISEVKFRSRKLNEYRAKARRQAAASAKEKAINYASSLGKGLGDVLHIEDVNPAGLQGNEGNVTAEIETTNEDQPKAYDPGHITVKGAVLAVFSLTNPPPQ